MIYQDNSFSIGRTPLVKLNRVTENARSHGAGEGGGP